MNRWHKGRFFLVSDRFGADFPREEGGATPAPLWGDVSPQRVVETIIRAHFEGKPNDRFMSVLIGNADSDQKREEAFISLMQMENVAGLIIAPTREDSPALAAASHLGLPVVVIDRRMSNIEVDTILADNFKGSLLAIQHLIQLGHKRIGVVSGPLHLTSARERYTGYLQAMSDAGLAVETDLTRFGDFRQASGYALTRELLEMPHSPSALFVANNLTPPWDGLASPRKPPETCSSARDTPNSNSGLDISWGAPRMTGAQDWGGGARICQNNGSKPETSLQRRVWRLFLKGEDGSAWKMMCGSPNRATRF